jgi:hypothetical protein
MRNGEEVGMPTHPEQQTPVMGMHPVPQAVWPIPQVTAAMIPALKMSTPSLGEFEVMPCSRALLPMTVLTKSGPSCILNFFFFGDV